MTNRLYENKQFATGHRQPLEVLIQGRKEDKSEDIPTPEPNIINVEIPYASTYVVSDLVINPSDIGPVSYNAFGFITPGNVLHVFQNNSKFIGIDDQNKVCAINGTTNNIYLEDFIQYQTPSTLVPDSWEFEELDCAIGDTINIIEAQSGGSND